MRMQLKLSATLTAFVFCLINSPLFAQKLDEFVPEARDARSSDVMKNTVEDDFKFNGYTNYWHDQYDRWIRYGNLFKMVIPDVNANIEQSKVDIAEDMGVPGLSMQEGFMNGLIGESFTTLDQPSEQHIEQSLQKGNVLVILDPGSEAGKKLSGKYSGSLINKDGHQLGARDLVKVNAFVLQKDNRKIFVISSKSSDYRNKVKKLTSDALQVVKDYDLHKGWFGASLSRTDTLFASHRLDLISRGMNEGNDWFVFNGAREVFAKKEVEGWISKVNLPVVTDAGYTPVYGCKNYDSLQIQSGRGDEAWIKFAHERGGYVFHQVADTVAGNYDGFMGGEGNKKQIDNEEVPFIPASGNQGTGRQSFFNPENEYVPSMIVFVKKGEKFTIESLWKSIMSRKEVAVLRQGKLMGPTLYRNAVNMLALDREFLEEYYGDRINIDATADGNRIKVRLTNTYPFPLSGNLKISLPAELKIIGSMIEKVDLGANSAKTVTYMVQPTSDAMSKVNPIAVHFNWGRSKKSIIAAFDLSPAKSTSTL